MTDDDKAVRSEDRTVEQAETEQQKAERVRASRDQERHREDDAAARAQRRAERETHLPPEDNVVEESGGPVGGADEPQPAG